MDGSPDQSPSLNYWHVWTDERGVSHQEQRTIARFEQESMGGDADPQWNRHLLDSAAHVMYSVLPVGWEGDWHENPKPQWIIPLSGRWFVETMDGKRVEMGPGEISFGADQNTQADADGRKGHRSGTVGNEPAVLMLVQLEDEQWTAVPPKIWEGKR